jgi:hypothetical protein
MSNALIQGRLSGHALIIEKWRQSMEMIIKNGKIESVLVSPNQEKHINSIGGVNHAMDAWVNYIWSKYLGGSEDENSEQNNEEVV